MVNNEVLAAKQDALSAQISELNATIKNFATTYARNDIIELRFKEIDIQIAALKVQLNIIENKKGFFSWLVPVITALLSALVTFLLLAYIGAK